MGTQLNTAELNKTVKKKEIGLENKKSGILINFNIISTQFYFHFFFIEGN